ERDSRSLRASGVRTGAVPMAVGSSTHGWPAATAASTVAGIPSTASVLSVLRFINNASATVVSTGASCNVTVIIGRAPAASNPSATVLIETVAVMQWITG